MKFHTPFLIVTLSLAARSAAFGQGTFQNLDFESAALVSVPGDPFGSVYAAQALPGWTGYIGTQQATSVWNNNIPVGGAFPFISIDGPDFPFPNHMQGHYYLTLGAGIDSLGNPIPAALAQTGQVPGTARAVHFLATAQVNLSFAGHPMVVFPLGNGQFGADISPFASQAGELRFEVNNSIPRLDFIQFSDQPIPEPSTLGLFAIGTLFLGWKLRRKPNL
ncbi:MAG: PEP-CTERM sorting domain-containing protein [Verrucomicrobia subdivision 3 bacterium]|nr:PEP-CTERM sorting domain-containing protein [Limisphaerales bacterium]